MLNFEQLKDHILKYSRLARGERTLYANSCETLDQVSPSYKHMIILGEGLCKIVISKAYYYGNSNPEQYTLNGKPHQLNQHQLEELYLFSKKLLQFQI